MPYLRVDTQGKAIFLNQACLDILEIDGPVSACLGKVSAISQDTTALMREAAQEVGELIAQTHVLLGLMDKMKE